VAIFFKKWNPIRLLQNLNFSRRQANDSEYSCINAIIEHCTSPSISNVRVCSWLKFKFGGELMDKIFPKRKMKNIIAENVYKQYIFVFINEIYIETVEVAFL
jgi:hypothetical protein